MPDPWIDSVKSSGQLSVHSTLAGSWRTLFADALREFNTLSAGHRLGVTLTATTESGANVEVQTGNGAISCTYAGATARGVLSGQMMHGRSFLFSVGGKVEKAHVYVPSGPLVNTPRGQRPVGTNVMKLILVHELVHACGLTNDEHSRDDLFQASPQVDPGTNASDDRVRIESGGRMSWMPPLVLSATTVTAIKSLWT